MDTFLHFHQAILAQLSSYLKQYPHCQRWVVGFSGGVDSTVLLHSVVTANQLLDEPRLVVACHVNHQLSKNAAVWQEHSRQFAESLGVSFSSHGVAVVSQGKGIEAAARQARYDVFKEALGINDCLLLGHHQGDQAETLLYRLFRGSGVRGLAAMPVVRRVGHAQLMRPLLSATKQDIQSYAERYALTWVNDDSNDCDDYDRNFLRHSVLPVVRQRWPAIEKQLSQLANRMRQTDDLLNELAEEDFAQCDPQPARWGESVDFHRLKRFSTPRINNIVRYWCDNQGYALPGYEHLLQIESQLFSADAVLSSACIRWNNIELRQFANRIYLMPAVPTFMAKGHIPWNGLHTLELENAGQLNAAVVTGNGLLLQPNQRCTIRWRQGGERCTPVQRQHSQTVKKLLQEYALETWLRDRVPLIYINDELAAVGDLWINKGFAALNDQRGFVLRWLCFSKEV